MKTTSLNAVKMTLCVARIDGLSKDPEEAMILKYLSREIILTIVGYLLKVHVSEDNHVEKKVISLIPDQLILKHIISLFFITVDSLRAS